MTTAPSLLQLSDDDLVAHVKAAARDERCATGCLVAALAEFDRRKLYRAQGCSSLFTYCTDVLHLSEAAACNRSAAARAAAKFPAVLGKLRDGSLSLTAVRLLAPVLTVENATELLDRATHQSTREVERLVATLRPKPDVAPAIRKLPDRLPAVRAVELPLAVASADAPPDRQDVTSSVHTFNAPASDTPQIRTPPRRAGAVIAPLSAERYKIQFTASRDVHDKLRRAQELMRHANPSGDPAVIVERALDLLLAQLAKQKFAATVHPRTVERSTARHSRHIPAAVRREVSRRDGERCAFVGAEGRCRERAFLEFHHVQPFADGGPATVDNVQLRCRTHNQYEADLLFGAEPDEQTEPCLDDFADRHGAHPAAIRSSSF